MAGNGLQHGEGPQSHFGVRGLQDVPGDGGRVHPAAQHGNHVGGEDETQRTLAEDGTHLSTLAREGADGQKREPRRTRRTTKEPQNLWRFLRIFVSFVVEAIVSSRSDLGPCVQAAFGATIRLLLEVAVLFLANTGGGL